MARLAAEKLDSDQPATLNLSDSSTEDEMPSKKHGMSGSPEYRVWNKIKDRCTNKNAANYYRYGGRGITICDKWSNSFMSFYNDIGPRPSASHSIDRIDNTKGYYPDNCRWATRLQQANNTRHNHRLTFGGKTRTIAQWSRITGLSHETISARIKQYGWSVEKTLSTPARPKRTKVQVRI